METNTFQNSHNNPLTFMDAEGSLLRTQEPTTCPCPEPLKSSRRPTLCLKHTFQKYAPILRESLSPRHGAPLAYGWSGPPLLMEGGCVKFK